MAHHMGLITGDPSLPQEEVQRLVEREILPYLLEFHAGTNLNSIPAKSQKLLSRLHYDPRDEKFESIVKLSAAQQAFVDTVCKCTASEKAFKELETAYDDHSSQANEVNKRYKQIDEESEEAFQCLQMKHQQEIQDLMQDLKRKHVMEHRKLKSEDYEKSEAIGKEYESILETEAYHHSRKDMAKMQFETDDEAKCKAKQAVIDAENEAKQLQIMGAGMVMQSVNDLPLTNKTYPRIIALMGGVEKIDKLIPRLTEPKTAKVCASLHNLGLPQNKNFKTDGVSLTCKKRMHKRKFESIDEHRYRLYQALSQGGNVQYDSGKILEKKLQDKKAETEAKETRILEEATALNRKRDPIAQELDYTPRGKRKREELNHLYRSPSPGFGRLIEANSSTRIKRSHSRFTSPANGLRQSQMLSQDTRDRSPEVFTPHTLAGMFEK